MLQGCGVHPSVGVSLRFWDAVLLRRLFLDVVAAGRGGVAEEGLRVAAVLETTGGDGGGK